ncbi:MAG: hypothetical protein WCP26_15235, partial [Actinomycetes bacterium]
MTDEVLSPPSDGVDSGVPAVALEVGGERRIRNRLARLAPGRRQSNPEIEPIVRTVKQFHPRADTEIIERAYEVAA